MSDPHDDGAAKLPAESEPGWERPPSATEAFAAPAHDPRDIITPHAFRIAPSLLGLPLATPRQRAIAIAIDGLLVVMLTKTGGVLLAMVAAVFIYGWLKNRYRPSSKLGRGLGASARLMVALLIFSVVVSMVQPLWERYADSDEDDDESRPSKALTMSGASGLAFGASVLALNACEDADCRGDAAEAMAASLAAAKGDRAGKLSNIGELIDSATDDAAERSTLKARAAEALDDGVADTAGKPAVAVGNADAPTAAAVAAAAALEDHQDKKPEYSLLKQIYGMLDDLGLSIGWAAAYFTLFTTLWAGQTPGKKLMHIRVVHLSGRPMSYWASFSRYGGYAAGLTTGLLGFLQVYWDPNRQAVQDQLSFTAVIRDVDLSSLKPEPKS